MRERDMDTWEQPIRNAWERGDHEGAVSLTLKTYGPELLQYLIARLRAYDDGWDAYGLLADDLWKGMAGFEWRCSMRCWAYTLARNAANRRACQRSAQQRGRCFEAGGLSDLAPAQNERTATNRCFTTATKQRVRHLREQLSHDEQELLLLRIDRQLSWGELARVLHGGADPGDAMLGREEARLRKRFERITHKLRALALAEGLLD